MLPFKTRESFFVVLLIVITLMTTADLISDYYAETDRWHVVLEALIVVFSVFGVGFLLWEIIQRQREMESLKKQLQETRANLSQSRSHLKTVGKEFTQAIHEQFGTWALTPSECEIAILLLKGLSFEEIAGIRQTKEKTVRQQASAIYRKSGLNGRHEFAAWFFEDLIM